MTDEPRVDAAALVRAIQEEVARRRAAGEYPLELLARLDEPLSDAEDDDIPEALAVVESARPLRSTRRGGRAIVFGKRVVRRLLAWYVAPIAEDQTRFNLALLRDLRALETRLARIATPFDQLRPPAARAAEVSHEARIDALLGVLTPSRRNVIAVGEMAVVDALVAPGRIVERPGSDPLDALDRAPARRADAVVLAGVLPMLSATELIGIMPRVWRTLQPRGIVIADAPTVPSQPRDPSAVQPAYVRWLHPETIALLFEASGFEDRRVVAAGESWVLHTAVRGAE